MRGLPALRAACAALLLSLASRGAAAARLEARTGALQPHRVESLLTDALRAPHDSVALARALTRLTARLQDEGYLDAGAEGGWRAPIAGEEPVLEVDVREGPRYRVARIDFDTPPADSSGFAQTFGVQVGQWASPGGLAAASEAALRRLSEGGYAYAQVTVNGFDWDSAGARIRVTGVPGPRVTIGGARIEGLRATRAGFATRALGRAVGHPFDPAAAEAGRERLLQLGLFRTVTWEGLEGEADASRAQLRYRVEELRYNRFEGAIGARPGGGTSGLLRLDLGNLAGTGRVIGARWEGRGHGMEVLAARYVEPLLMGTPIRIEAMVESQREDTLFTRERIGASLQFLLSGRERIEAGYEQDHVLKPRFGVSEADLQTTTFALERDTRDSPLIARRGSRVRLSASQSFKREHLVPSGREKANASAAEGRIDVHRILRERLGVAWQLLGAARFSSQPVLAVFERFPLGGASSLRGFDEQAFRVDRYGLSRAEARWFLGAGGQHVALFWDHAWTFTRVDDPAGARPVLAHKDGIGFGIRLEGPTGVIGVDYGLEPGRPPAEGKLHVQLVSSF